MREQKSGTLKQTNFMTTTEGNELIAKWQGHTVYKNHTEMHKVPINELKPYYLVGQLQYHSSWDWLLMPKSLKKSAARAQTGEIRNRFCEIRTHGTGFDQSFVCTTTIIAVWNLCVSLYKMAQRAN